MTMSVGLAKIQNDPDATIMTRKALGALSTPGLLVHDTGLSIDGDGRIFIRLKPDGGLVQDENGLSVIEEVIDPEPIKVGIDSEVDPRSEAYDREWNARLTGPAPNYFEGSLAIGAETFAGVSIAAAALGITIEDAKVNITSKTTQLRLSYDTSNYMAMRVVQNGYLEVFSISPTDAGIHFITGDGTTTRSGGIRVNDGTTIEQIFSWIGSLAFPGGGGAGTISWYEADFVLTGLTVATASNHHVTVSPKGGAAIPGEWLAFTARVSAANRLALRITWVGVTAADTRDWLFLVHKLS